MILRRRRFVDLARRQLELFARDEAALVEEARAAEISWQQADRDEAEEAYGDWQLIADAIAERLLDLQETYAATLDGTTAPVYRNAFGREARRRFPRFAALLDDESR